MSTKINDDSMSLEIDILTPHPNFFAEAEALLASACPSAAACDGLMTATPGMVEQGACLPTQSGTNRQPWAAV